MTLSRLDWGLGKMSEEENRFRKNAPQQEEIKGPWELLYHLSPNDERILELTFLPQSQVLEVCADKAYAHMFDECRPELDYEPENTRHIYRYDEERDKWILEKYVTLPEVFDQLFLRAQRSVNGKAFQFAVMLQETMSDVDDGDGSGVQVA